MWIKTNGRSSYVTTGACLITLSRHAAGVGSSIEHHITGGKNSWLIAFASAIEHIKSDRYDLIVFDTAPTGHTLKLLGMPDILQAGIEKLQGWQSAIWTYWDVMKGMASSALLNRKRAKDEVATMLENYKRGIQKVALNRERAPSK